jgi:ethanolamine utilization protein EutN
MELAKIIGTIVATRKHHSLEGTRLCVIQPLDYDMQEVDVPIVAVDTESQAGYGEIVFTVTGGDAAAVSERGPMPVDVAIVGIVHSISVSEEVEK